MHTHIYTYINIQFLVFKFRCLCQLDSFRIGNTSISWLAERHPHYLVSLSLSSRLFVLLLYFLISNLYFLYICDCSFFDKKDFHHSHIEFQIKKKIFSC